LRHPLALRSGMAVAEFVSFGVEQLHRKARFEEPRTARLARTSSGLRTTCYGSGESSRRRSGFCAGVAVEAGDVTGPDVLAGGTPAEGAEAGDPHAASKVKQHVATRCCELCDSYPRSSSWIMPLADTLSRSTRSFWAPKPCSCALSVLAG
jgi:hypothetical protein